MKAIRRLLRRGPAAGPGKLAILKQMTPAELADIGLKPADAERIGRATGD